MPGWRESLLVGALAAQQLVRLELGPGDVVTPGERIDLGERVRDLRQGSDGAIYMLTDSDTDSRMLRLAPR